MTSFYFATRGQTERKDEPDTPKKTEPTNPVAPSPIDAEAHVDGCDVPSTDSTSDAELPPARGGVAPPPTSTGG